MMDHRFTWERAASAIFLAAPVASLLLSAISWLHYGIDLPFYDDFRVYIWQTALSLDPRALFAPANDTLYPVGMALDALAQRFLNGNAVAYQFISMIVLMGGLLALQWRLLSTTLPDRLVAAFAFALCLLMTWPESYWGLQSMAYHHGLPLLFLLGALTVIVDRGWAAWWGVPSVFILGLLAGFSYISGAIASLAIATVLVLATAMGLPHVRGLRAGGRALLAAAAVTVPAQVWVILFFQHGRIHDPAAGWALPTESAFWMFLLGKIGRSLALPYERPVAGLVITLFALLAVGVLAAQMVRRFWRERAALPEEAARITLIFFALAAAIAAYLPLIAAGRANIMPPDPKTPLNMFIQGFPEHYHSVWVTLLFPWIAAAVFVAARPRFALPIIRNSAIAPLAAAALIAAAGAAGAFSHGAYFSGIQAFRLGTDIPCIRKALAENVVACPERYGPELLNVLRYGRQIGASFVRYFPYPPIPLGTESPPPLFRLSEAPEALEPNNVTFVSTAEGLSFTAAFDAGFTLTLPAGSLRSCWEMEVSMEIKTDVDDFAELFVLPTGQRDFQAPSASFAMVRGREFTTVTLRALNIAGFEERLRLDPVGISQPFTIRDLEVRCRGNVPGQSG